MIKTFKYETCKECGLLYQPTLNIHCRVCGFCSEKCKAKFIKIIWLLNRSIKMTDKEAEIKKPHTLQWIFNVGW